MWWPWRRPDLPRPWKARIEDLEDDLAHLERRFVKFRGQVTGHQRKASLQDDSGATIDELDVSQPPPLELIDEPDPYRALGAQLRFGKGGE